ncbi:hypothetical protein BGZ73_001277, partial [Actinomortierella ambigua]
MLPDVETLMTEAAKDLHANLDAFIKEKWPLLDITDAELLALYLNPACAKHSMLDHVDVVDVAGAAVVDGNGARVTLRTKAASIVEREVNAWLEQEIKKDAVMP